MSDYRYQLVKRNEIDCLHVMIDSNSLKEIADTHIPLGDILESATAQGFMTLAPQSPTARELALKILEIDEQSSGSRSANEAIIALCNEILAKG